MRSGVWTMIMPVLPGPRQRRERLWRDYLLLAAALPPEHNHLSPFRPDPIELERVLAGREVDPGPARLRRPVRPERAVAGRRPDRSAVDLQPDRAVREHLELVRAGLVDLQRAAPAQQEIAAG